MVGAQDGVNETQLTDFNCIVVRVCSLEANCHIGTYRELYEQTDL